jgi:hypothetical protein
MISYEEIDDLEAVSLMISDEEIDYLEELAESAIEDGDWFIKVKPNDLSGLIARFRSNRAEIPADYRSDRDEAAIACLVEENRFLKSKQDSLVIELGALNKKLEEIRSTWHDMRSESDHNNRHFYNLLVNMEYH